MGIFATYPNDHVSTANGFFDQVSNYMTALQYQLLYYKQYAYVMSKFMVSCNSQFLQILLSSELGSLVCLQFGRCINQKVQSCICQVVNIPVTPTPFFSCWSHGSHAFSSIKQLQTISDYSNFNV